MLSPEEKEMSLQAPCIGLKFLLEPRSKTVDPASKGFSDSGYFYRLWDLFDCLREPEVTAILNEEQQEALKHFRERMAQMDWQVVSADPNIKELQSGTLEDLRPAAQRLYNALLSKRK